MQVPLLDLKAQFSDIKDQVMPAIDEVCQSQFLCLGPAVEKFEKEIADFCHCKFALGVSSGSDALLASLMALDIKTGDEVITTPFTFFATAGAVVRTGAKPVFVDIDPDSFNIDPKKIEEKITPKTKAIIPVHIFGQIAQMKPICEIAARHNLAIIEDACQSIGAVQDGKKAGTFGDFGCFSFYPTKNLGAFGDAGLVTTDNPALYEKLKITRDHGQNPRYYYKFVGGNFRLDGIQGAVLSVKLKYLEKWSEKRRQNAQLYNELLADTPVKTPVVEENNISIFHQYTICAPKRDDLQKHLAENQVSSAVFYPKPLHIQDCFADLDYKQGDFPITEKTCQQVLSLPVYPELKKEQIEFVAEKIKAFYN